jgi:hypothetical protein
MKDYVVSTQNEYDRAMEQIALARKRPFYDIEYGRGTEIVEEVDYLVHHYVYRAGDKKLIYDGLSHLDFDKPQADKIMEYFQEHLPRDLFDIERGLNRLRVMPQGYDTGESPEVPKLIIKDSREKIAVRSGVEVCGNSFVEAFDRVSITARNKAHIIAHDSVSVEAYHKARVDAYDHSRIRAFNNARVTASGESQVEAYHKSFVMATEKSKVTAYHDVYIKGTNDSGITVFDKAVVDVWDNCLVSAFNKSHIFAWGSSAVSACDRSLVHAADKSKIEARNQSCVIARENASVSGSDDSFILTCDNAGTRTRDNSHFIDKEHNNAANLRSNLLTILRHSRFAGDPILAMNILMQAIPQENREGIREKLLSMGCTDADKTKTFLKRWVKTPDKDVSYER